jgi:hypothetical protein
VHISPNGTFGTGSQAAWFTPITGQGEWRFGERTRICRRLSSKSRGGAARKKRASKQYPTEADEQPNEDGKHHGDGKKIAEDFAADVAADHSESITLRQRARLVPIKIRSHVSASRMPRRRNAAQDRNVERYLAIDPR